MTDGLVWLEEFIELKYTAAISLLYKTNSAKSRDGLKPTSDNEKVKRNENKLFGDFNAKPKACKKQRTTSS